MYRSATLFKSDLYNAFYSQLEKLESNNDQIIKDFQFKPNLSLKLEAPPSKDDRVKEA